jgi:hypothetical protein
LNLLLEGARKNKRKKTGNMRKRKRTGRAN